MSISHKAVRSVSDARPPRQDGPFAACVFVAGVIAGVTVFLLVHELLGVCQ